MSTKIALKIEKFVMMNKKETKDLSIINNIIQILSKKGLSQNELCKYLGITTSTMSTWKKRNSDPPAKYIIRICEFLNISPYMLLTGKECQTETNNAHSSLNENESEMLEIFRQFTDREQIKIIGKMEAWFAEKQRRAIANQKQIHMQTAYIAARSSDKHSPKIASGNFSDVENAPDVTDEY